MHPSGILVSLLFVAGFALSAPTEPRATRTLHGWDKPDSPAETAKQWYQSLTFTSPEDEVEKTVDYVILLKPSRADPTEDDVESYREARMQLVEALATKMEERRSSEERPSKEFLLEQWRRLRRAGVA